MDQANRDPEDSGTESLIFQTIADRLGEDEPYYQIVITHGDRKLVYDVLLNVDETLKH